MHQMHCVNSRVVGLGSCSNLNEDDRRQHICSGFALVHNALVRRTRRRTVVVLNRTKELIHGLVRPATHDPDIGEVAAESSR
jgi:hypothetical protein